jgi:transcriptional/translational regulatory protein YebC/TACO1
MADPGSVSYMFERKGVIIVKKRQGEKTISEELILDSALEHGLSEINDLGESFELICAATDLVPVRQALQNSSIDYESADVSFLPSISIPIGADDAKALFELIEAIEECDDVQNVYGNFDVSDEVMASLS